MSPHTLAGYRKLINDGYSKDYLINIFRDFPVLFCELIRYILYSFYTVIYFLINLLSDSNSLPYYV